MGDRGVGNCSKDEPIIIWEDQHIAAFVKGPGWLVTISRQIDQNKALLRLLQARGITDPQELVRSGKPEHFVHYVILKFKGNPVYTLSDSVDHEFGIAHRLDVDTSGALLMGKTASGFTHLRQCFSTHEVFKEYICLVHGAVKKASDEIELPILWDEYSNTSTISGNGLWSKSIYTVMGRFRLKGGKKTFTLCRVVIITGRTHQIRIHMAAVGHPLVADSKYNSKHVSTDNMWCPRLFLHAWRVGFADVQHKFQEVKAPLSKDLQAALKHMEAVQLDLNNENNPSLRVVNRKALGPLPVGPVQTQTRKAISLDTAVASSSSSQSAANAAAPPHQPAFPRNNGQPARLVLPPVNAPQHLDQNFPDVHAAVQKSKSIGPGRHRGAKAPWALQLPLEEACERLVEMGFDRDRSLRALRANGGDIGEAMDMLSTRDTVEERTDPEADAAQDKVGGFSAVAAASVTIAGSAPQPEPPFERRIPLPLLKAPPTSKPIVCLDVSPGAAPSRTDERTMPELQSKAPPFAKAVPPSALSVSAEVHGKARPVERSQPQVLSTRTSERDRPQMPSNPSTTPKQAPWGGAGLQGANDREQTHEHVAGVLDVSRQEDEEEAYRQAQRKALENVEIAKALALSRKAEKEDQKKAQEDAELTRVLAISRQEEEQAQQKNAEDEDLARALAVSRKESDINEPGADDDADLAKILELSRQEEEEMRRKAQEREEQSLVAAVAASLRDEDSKPVSPDAEEEELREAMRISQQMEDERRREEQVQEEVFEHVCRESMANYERFHREVDKDFEEALRLSMLEFDSASPSSCSSGVVDDDEQLRVAIQASYNECGFDESIMEDSDEENDQQLRLAIQASRKETPVNDSIEGEETSCHANDAVASEDDTAEQVNNMSDIVSDSCTVVQLSEGLSHSGAASAGLEQCGKGVEREIRSLPPDAGCDIEQTEEQESSRCDVESETNPPDARCGKGSFQSEEQRRDGEGANCCVHGVTNCGVCEEQPRDEPCTKGGLRIEEQSRDDQDAHSCVESEKQPHDAQGSYSYFESERLRLGAQYNNDCSKTDMADDEDKLREEGNRQEHRTQSQEDHKDSVLEGEREHVPIRKVSRWAARAGRSTSSVDSANSPAATPEIAGRGASSSSVACLVVDHTEALKAQQKQEERPCSLPFTTPNCSSPSSVLCELAAPSLPGAFEDLGAWMFKRHSELKIELDKDALWFALNEIEFAHLQDHDLLKMWLGLSADEKLPASVDTLVEEFMQGKRYQLYQSSSSS